jgi:hypothetical protein
LYVLLYVCLCMFVVCVYVFVVELNMILYNGTSKVS